MKRSILLGYFLFVYVQGQSLQEFTVQYISQPEKRIKFRNYYSDFLDRMSRVSSKRKTKRLVRLRQEALRIAEFKNKKLYKQLVKAKQTDVQKQTKETRLLLTRYRVLEDFNEYNDAKHAYVWYKTKHACSKIFHTISGNVRSFKKALFA